MTMLLSSLLIIASSSSSSSASLSLTPLPEGISPFESSRRKIEMWENADVEKRSWTSRSRSMARRLGDGGRTNGSSFRSFQGVCVDAISRAHDDGIRAVEMEFPPLLSRGKTSFDDFDNLQELDANRDWCVALLPLLSSRPNFRRNETNNGKNKTTTTTTKGIWFLLPDGKECELCKEAWWPHAKYRDAAQYTTIEAVTTLYHECLQWSKAERNEKSPKNNNNNKNNNDNNNDKNNKKKTESASFFSKNNPFFGGGNDDGDDGDVDGDGGVVLESAYAKPMGANFATGMNQFLGGLMSSSSSSSFDDDDDENDDDRRGGGRGGGRQERVGDAGLLGDVNALDDLRRSHVVSKKKEDDDDDDDDDASSSTFRLLMTPKLHLVCQPGNGGPVEDWINCERLHRSGVELAKTTTSSSDDAGSSSSSAAAAASSVPMTCFVNGALDKVRDGYYPSLAFPSLASSSRRFYNRPGALETIVYLKPLSDKGSYGWLYRVYPEPWQIIRQEPTTTTTSTTTSTGVKNTVVYTSEKRPTYREALQRLLQGGPSK